ncbi:MAG: hypothetical protein EOO90_07405 [Pedobacter sp.]|nr:MAG: hypothetical protein EOO90_07405 [Pedobacter sp.]
MKVKILLLLISLIHTCVFAQSDLITEGNIKQKTYLTAIDFELEQSKIVIPVTIGDKNYRFLFDTGAANTINIDAISNLSKVGKLNVSDSNNLEDSLTIAKVPTFKINDLVFENFNFLQYDFSKNLVLNCFKLDGIIGSNSFKNSIIKIDYKEKKIYVTDKLQSLSISAKGNKMKLLGKQKSPYLEISLGEKKRVLEDVLFDTGYNKFYSQSKRAFAVFSKENVLENVKSSKAKLSISLFGSDSTSEKSILTIPNFAINSTHFKNIIAYTSNDNNSKIGTELLTHGNITLDFKRSKYYFEAHSNHVDLKENYPLFAPSFENGRLIIGMVINDNLKKDLVIGSIILSVDGKDVKAENCGDILNFKYPMEKFSVLQNGKTVEIQMKNYL